MTEQVSATGSREPAKDADVDFGGLTFRIAGAMRSANAFRHPILASILLRV
jgi:hypothetical protein